ncbi:hypothetical protein BJY24_001726 [Nocardia transvalensis]|uniref:WXG100 family type VII secretion target n=1 Tax=Nocardia transvalensis TaxID=37333 RepID=A0A7W9UH08_9NOCA|nr:hypothetical protein [Nocardia transvalensis]MBB5912859.1 hypothetical protein [Nocardia transvalensis]
MAGNLKVTAHGLRSTAGHLDGVIGKLRRIHDGVDKMDAAAAGWMGTDSIGHALNDPAKGYDISAKNTRENLSAKIELLQTYRDGLIQGAEHLEKMEDDNRQDVDVRT